MCVCVWVCVCVCPCVCVCVCVCVQIDVPDTERGYPPPKPPRDRKDNVFKEKECATIDANAKGVRMLSLEHLCVCAHARGLILQVSIE